MLGVWCADQQRHCVRLVQQGPEGAGLMGEGNMPRCLICGKKVTECGCL